MAKTSIVLPDDVLTEIDDRRHSTTHRSVWIEAAIRKRLELEDSGEWTEPTAYISVEAEA
jgi:metal-responsive CopG/Arc/MetJ family transcriptional regulator